MRNDIFWSTWDVGQLLQKGVAPPIAEYSSNFSSNDSESHPLALAFAAE